MDFLAGLPEAVREGFRNEMDLAESALGSLVADVEERGAEVGDPQAVKLGQLIALLRDEDRYSRPMLAHLVAAATDQLAHRGPSS
jgi:hypothetical protein